jgi:hypothetical protein
MLTEQDAQKIMFAVTAGLILHDIIRRVSNIINDAIEGWMKR